MRGYNYNNNIEVNKVDVTDSIKHLTGSCVRYYTMAGHAH